MKLSIIAAIGENNELGYRNKLLWHIPADLKHFKQITTGHAVVMGRLTFESIGNKPLPKRRNIVLTTSGKVNHPEVETAASLEEALDLVNNEGEVFILGGGTVYEQFLPLTQTMYLTHVHQRYQADTFFPEFDPAEWEIEEKEDITDDEKAGVAYSFVTYSRKKT